MSQIHPTAIIHDGASIGAGVSIGPYCVVGADVELGDHCTLHNHVSIEGNTQLGQAVEVYPFASLGGRPQIKGDQTSPGRLTIGDDCVFREHVTVHTGSSSGRGATEIGSDGLFMVGSHIGHDCIVGKSCVFANRATLGGHVSVGDEVWIGGHSAIHQNCQVGRLAFIGGGSKLVGDVIPFAMTLGNQAQLRGLNLRGLKRKGFSREQLHALRAAYRMLAAQERSFADRLNELERMSESVPMIEEIVSFLKRNRRRPLCHIYSRGSDR